LNFLNNIVSIAAGGQHSAAVDSNGEVWAWGSNSFGQLGNGLQVNSPGITTPVQIVE
jgi:alpha-tubulin suppressor-like RCC1 family protein